MTKIWHADAWDEPQDKHNWGGAMGGLTWPGEYAESVMGPINWGELFAYMYRRFGPTEYGSDYHKEIACWYITTPDPNVVLVVTPRPSSIRFCFGYHVNERIYYDRRNKGQVEAVNRALKAAMRDLLVPTNVRDIFINAAGRVKDEDIPEETVGYFKHAGCGVMKEYYESLGV